MYLLKKRHPQPKSPAGRLRFALMVAALLCSLSANLQSRQREFAGIAEARIAAAPDKGIAAKLCGTVTAFSGWPNSFFLQVQAPYWPPFWTQSLLLLLAAYLSVFVVGLPLYLAQRRQDVDEGNPAVERRSRQVSRLLTVIGAGSSIAMLLIGLLRSSNPVISVSGAALLVAGSAIWPLGRERGRTAERLRVVGSWLVLATGVLSFVAEITNGKAFAFVNGLGIERMPQAAALSLVLLGCASLFAGGHRLAGFGQFLAVLVVFTTWLQMLSALYGVSAVNGLAAHLIMRAPCAITMLALGLATLTATPHMGLMKTICSPRLGGLMLRHLLPVAVVIPAVLGWLRLQSQVLGLVDARLGEALFALSIVLLFCVLMWSCAAVLNRLDRQKSASEEALRERQRKLDLIFETVAMGDFTWDVTTNHAVAHRSVWKMYGEPEGKVGDAATWFTSRQHPDDLPRIAEELARVRAGQQLFDLEFRVIWPDASIHWLHCRALPVFDHNGKLVQTTGISLDITDRKLAEVKLKESEILFRELADAMPQIVWTSGKDGVANYHNRRWREYTGLLPGQSWREIVSETDFAAISGKWNTSIKSGNAYEDEILIRRASDGMYRWHLARAVPIRNTQGEIERWFGTCIDIHDFKRATKQVIALNENLERRVQEHSDQLAQAEREYWLLIESVKDYAIYMLDRDGRVSRWNAGAERLTGYTATEIIGKHFSIFYSLEDKRRGEPERHLATATAEGRVSYEALCVRKDGHQFWGNTLMGPVYDGAGQVCGFSRIVRDVTEWRQTTELLIAAQKRAEEANIAKSSFLAAMSHEIRTPMNAILGMADLLWETELKPIQREYVGRFRRAGANLLTLINDILDLSKIESGRFDLEQVDFDLLELVDRVVEIASPKAMLRNISLQTEVVPGTPAFLIGDPVRLQQILNNLIGNAIKFTQSGGITLRVGPHRDGRPAHLDFAVTDTGIGIPANKLTAIFEDFTQAESSTTRRFGGTGLGLGICRRLVEKMEGRLTVESIFGEGSTFRFDVVLEISEKTSDALPAVLSNLSGMQVLVVDDNATNRMIICEMCAGWGMQTCSASSAAQGLRLIQEAPKPFSLIVLDRLLPGESGFETLEKIKRFDSNLAVIISSSDHQPGDITGAKALGAAYLMKPVRRAELLSCILAAVSAKRDTKQAAAIGADALVDNHTQSLASLRILLADDSEDNRFLVEAYLKGKSCHLSFAENGLEAVEAFRNGQFDVILMDVQMPKMDGLTATARIRELERERHQAPTAIFALTANALVEDSQRSYDAGCDGHLAKPIAREKLIAALLAVRENILAKAAQKGDQRFAINIPPGFADFSRGYIKKQREFLARAHSSLAGQNLDQLRTLGHNMKGTGGSYGFPQLTILGAALEDAAKAANHQQLETEIVELNRYLEYATHYFSAQRSDDAEAVVALATRNEDGIGSSF